jgi:hypothetical protein
MAHAAREIMRHPAFAVAALAVATGCFDSTIGPDVVLSCEDDDDCPASLVCRQAIARCVSLRDLEQPAPVVGEAVVEPARVAVTGALTARFTVGGAVVSAPPSVALDLLGEARAFDLVSADGGAYVFTLALRGDEVAPDVEATRAVSATVVSALGNPQVVELGRIVVDDRAPALALDVADGVIGASEPLRLVVTASEALVDVPVCTGPVALHLQEVQGTRAVFVADLDGVADGAHDLRCQGTDTATNVGEAVATIQLDTVAPAVTDLGVDLSGLDGGAGALVSFTVDDASATVDVVVDGVDLSCTVAAGLVGLRYTCGFDLDRSGIAAIVVTARDAAGNVTVESTISLDDRAPTLSDARLSVVPPNLRFDVPVTAMTADATLQLTARIEPNVEFALLRLTAASGASAIAAVVGDSDLVGALPLPDGFPEGSATVELSVITTSGRRETFALGNVVVDTTRPAVPPVGVPGAVVLRRIDRTTVEIADVADLGDVTRVVVTDVGGAVLAVGPPPTTTSSSPLPMSPRILNASRRCSLMSQARKSGLFVSSMPARISC